VPLPVAVDVPAERFARTIEAHAYFIVAEALTNVVKHARASAAEVRVAVSGGHALHRGPRRRDRRREREGQLRPARPRRPRRLAEGKPAGHEPGRAAGP